MRATSISDFSHAVVIGGSVAGLLAARVLARHFARVTLLESDADLDGDLPRKGVPQGRQSHALLSRGVALLEEYFPGFTAETTAGGVGPVAFPEDVRWFQFGSWKSRAPCGMRIYPESRVGLEGRIRARVRGHPRVQIEAGRRVEGLMFEEGGARVAGVNVRREGMAETLPAALVVDASGRGSQCLRWLEAVGYKTPPREELRVDMGSATRIFWKPETARDWEVLGIHPLPGRARGGHIFPLDARRWIVTLFGYAGEQPPGDAAGFVEFARSLAAPDVARAIEGAEPASAIVRGSYFTQRRWRVDQAARFPEGLLLLGDALCSFDPVFGQGMTVACQEARALDETLAARSRWRAPLWKRYFSRCHQIVEAPWMLSVCERLRLEDMRGARSRRLRFLQWYTAHVFCLGAVSPRVGRAFFRVLHLEAAPSILFGPAILCRVLWRALLGRRAVPPGAHPARSVRASPPPPRHDPADCLHPHPDDCAPRTAGRHRHGLPFSRRRQQSR